MLVQMTLLITICLVTATYEFRREAHEVDQRDIGTLLPMRSINDRSMLSALRLDVSVLVHLLF